MINNSLMIKTMKLIKEGQEFLQIQNISDAVLFLGLTGVGKSTLINYLAGVQLESFEESGDIKLKAKDPSTELPQSKIGHSLSCTRYPTVYQPQGQTCCYIDAPGFEDTGNGGATEEDRAAQDIANAYFRSLIVTQTKRLKCVLLITEDDLKKGRGNGLTPIFKHLSNFIGAFGEDINTDLLEKIKESICIVVTQIPASKLGQNTMKGILEKLESIIQNPTIDRKNMLEVLKCIKDKKRVAIFSTPAGSSDKSFDEADLIKAMIDNTHFISTEEARITIQVSAAHQVKVQYAINDLIILTKEQLGLAINQDITQELKKYFESSPFDRKRLQLLQNSCESILKCNSQRTLQMFFENLCKIFEFLSVKTKNDFVEFIRFFNFFGGLLPGASEEERRRKDALLEKNWIQELDLAPTMNDQIQFITTLLDTPKFKLKDNELILTGFHIEINEVLKKLADENEYRNLKHIVFQAYHSLTIGQKVVSESKEVQEAFHGLKLHSVNVSLMAPQIFVLDKCKIDLSGANGENYPPDQAAATKGNDDQSSQADHGADRLLDDNVYRGNKGGEGKSGAPGKPAQSSGNLYIICDRLHNPKQLNVKLKGGNGGNGQRGGDGGRGGPGANVYGNRRRHPGVKCFTNGGPGGDAGQGGKGGDAGHAGKLTLIVEGQELVLDSNQLDIKKGKAGEPGVAGTPGIGGPHGTQRDSHGHDKPASSGNGPEGDKAQGLNDKGWVEVKSLAEQNYFKNLLNYRLELAKFQNKYPAVMGEYLSKFSEYYTTINLVNLNTTIADLLEAANTLEEYYLKYSKDEEYPTFNFVPLYSAFLEQIKAFSLAANRTTQDLKVLAYLYTATLGSIARLNAKADNILIVNIDGYLDDLKEKFSKLRDLKVEELKQFYKKQYHDGIADKIKEGEAFLDKLQIEVKSKLKNIEEAVKILKGEIETEIAKGQTENLELQKKKAKLKHKLRNKLIFSSIDLGLQAAGALYPPAKPGTDIARAGLKMAQDPNLQNAKELGNKAKNYKSDVKAQEEEYQKKKAADKEKDLFGKTESFVATVSPVAKEAGNVAKEAKTVKEAMKEIDQQIEQNNARLGKLEKHIQNLPTVNHYFEEAVEHITDFQTALQDKSLISLDFNKLERQRIFEDIKRNIDTMLGEFNAKAEFEDIVDRMHEAMDVSVNICSRIQEYREHSCFAEFVANSLSTSVEDVEIAKQYGNVLSCLKLRLQQSVVEEAYFRAVSAVKQWAFPFAERFLRNMETVRFKNFDELVRNLGIMNSKWNEYNKSVTNIDKAIHMCSKFGIAQRGQDYPPFVEWTYLQYPEKIKALLRGEEVYFVADVRSHTRLDAVKFRKLGFKFECNKSKQEELDTLQAGYEVTLKHSGISCYQYLGKFYQIANDYPLSISFQCGESEPSDKNLVWSKIAEGDIVLSPYTTWTVKIGKLSTAVQQTHKESNLFERFLDNNFKIKLIGTGSYVKPTEVNVDLKLEEHYQLYREKLSSYLPPEVQAKNDGECSRTQSTKSSLSLQEGEVIFSMAPTLAGASSSNKTFSKKWDEKDDQDYEHVSKPKSSCA